MRVACTQPVYMPWWGALAMIHSVDAFVFYDDVQVEKHSYQERCYIKVAHGQKMPLIVPTNASVTLPIHQVQIDQTKQWRRDHLRSIMQNYSRVECGHGLCNGVFRLIGRHFVYLADMNIALTRELYRILGGREVEWLRSSDLGPRAHGRIPHLIATLKMAGADHYLANKNSTYLLPAIPQFEDAGIKVEFADFVHKEYPQLYLPFVPGLSVIDILMNCGATTALKYCEEGICFRSPEERLAQLSPVS